MHTYDKPFKTYDELIQLLKDKDLIIEDELFAKRVLSETPYHILTHNYKIEYHSDDDVNKFNGTMTFNTLYAHYLFSRGIKNVLLKQILEIEKNFKTKLYYQIALKYGVSAGSIKSYTNKSKKKVSQIDCIPDDYLFKQHYSSSNDSRTNTLRRLKRAIIDARENGISYYRDNKNHIPPWILAGDISFGSSIMWYSILKDDDKTAICTEMFKYSSDSLCLESKKEFLKIALEFLRKYRNALAHGNKFFDEQIDTILPFHLLSNFVPSSVLSLEEYRQGLGQKDTFALMLVLSIFSNEKYSTLDFLIDINAVLERGLKGSSASEVCAILQIPSNTLERLKALLDSKNY